MSKQMARYTEKETNHGSKLNKFETKMLAYKT